MGVVYFSIIPTFEPSRYCKCWIVCFYYNSAREPIDDIMSTMSYESEKSDWIRSLLSKRHLKIENEILLEKKKKCLGKEDELFYL